ncbi:hypothetical protein Psuf_049850 [Phytohabitans suffuscus]|uniref:Uncharacterized protein n=1 Tax=Phytohabitans suffuscus TaxID=624315 RepID=A0A6F8YNH1_9ACTN|nr:hypothetical protein [Phytohabitans suffuscus]BCB87672.1 hypothetical protein Psuf_049850 [Phytohabitans suffuscus]
MLDRHDRDGDPGEPPHVSGRRAGRVHHDLGGDPPLAGPHRAHPAALHLDPGDPYPGVDLDAELARAGRERRGERLGAQVAVAGQPTGGPHVGDVQQRQPRLGLAGESSSISRPYVVAALTCRSSSSSRSGVVASRSPPTPRQPGSSPVRSRSSA